MKAIRFLTILFTAFSLYAVQAIQPVHAQTSSGFFSGGAGGEVTVDNEKKGDDEAGMNMNMVLLFGVVIAAPLLLMYCVTGKMDVKIFVGVSALYIASEIANWNSYKEQSKQEMKAYQTGSVEGDQAQKASLMEAAGQTQAAADAAKKRAAAAKIASMGFFAAAAVALVMAILDTPPPTPTGWCTGGDDGKCDTDMCTGGMASNDLFHDYTTPDTKHKAIAFSDYGSFQSYLKGADNDLNYLVRYYESQRLSNGAIASMTPKAAQQIEDIFPEKKDESLFVSYFKNASINIADLVLPEANAAMGGMASMGLAGAASLIIAKYVMTTKTTFSYLKSGYARAAIYAVYGGLAMKVAADAQAAADALMGRSAQYRELAARLGSQTMDTSNMAKVDTTMEIGKLETMNVKVDDVSAGTCFTGSAGKLNEDKNCKCKDANTCKKSEIPKIKMANVNLPSAVTSSMASTADSANSLFSGNLDGALAGAGNAEKNAARLQRIAVGLKEKVNKDIAGLGGTPIDFDKLDSNVRSKLFKAINADLKNMSKEAKDALANRFPGTFGDEKDTDPMKGIKMGDTKVVTGSGGGLKSKGSGSGKKKDPMAAFSFEMDESKDVAYDDKLATTELNSAKTGDQVETDSEDIDSDRNKNIFSLITKRYFKTAYPRFFDTDKP